MRSILYSKSIITNNREKSQNTPLLTNTIFVVKYTLCLLHKKVIKKFIKSIAIYKQSCYNKNIAKS